MDLINEKLKLPNYIEDWIKDSDYKGVYSEDSISATNILKPTQMIILENRYKNFIQVDISDLIASKIGSAIHNSFEKAEIKNSMQEKRVGVYKKINEKNYYVNGQFDLLIDLDKDKQKLVDFKTTSIWTYLYNSKNKEYAKQLSIYRWLLEENYKIVDIDDKAEICYIFTDWSKQSSIKIDNYPKSRILTKEIKLYPKRVTEKSINEKLKEIDNYRNEPDMDLPKCTSEELWAKNDIWAVHKNKLRALKLFDKEEDAKKFIENHKNKESLWIDFRKGEATRCKYCQVTMFCKQYSNLTD